MAANRSKIRRQITVGSEGKSHQNKLNLYGKIALAVWTEVIAWLVKRSVLLSSHSQAVKEAIRPKPMRKRQNDVGDVGWNQIRCQNSLSCLNEIISSPARQSCIHRGCPRAAHPCLRASRWQDPATEYKQCGAPISAKWDAYRPH